MEKDKVLKTIFDFYTDSNDFNGIPMTRLAKELEIDYLELIPVVIELIKDDSISVQDGENPHIIRWGHHDKESQIKLVEEAKNNKTKLLDTINPQGFPKEMSTINITFDSHLLCLYPSQKYLEKHFSDTKYDNLPFTHRLALGEAQMKPSFFEIDVLDRYFHDPRYRFEFDDYSGSISIEETETTPSLLSEHDQVFLETFGLGYKEDGERVVVAYLRYLSDLTSEHQTFWNSKIVTVPCEMVGEYYENTILGNWVFGQSIFSAIIEEQRIINEMAVLMSGKQLFRKSFEGDKRPKEFTFFTTPTLSNYENFIILLDKMLSDNINKDFFKGEVEEFEMVSILDGLVERKPKGTLRLLEEWLKKKYRVADQSDFDEIFNFETDAEELFYLYNQRGEAERQFSFMKNDFGWNLPPFMNMNENTVFFIVSALANNVFRAIALLFDEHLDKLELNARVRRFQKAFIDTIAIFIDGNWIYYNTKIDFGKIA